MGQFGSLSSDTLKHIIDKVVHDAHSLGGDTGIGVDLLQYLVDVEVIRFLALGLWLLASFLRSGLGSLDGLSGTFWGHVDIWV